MLEPANQRVARAKRIIWDVLAVQAPFLVGVQLPTSRETKFSYLCL